MAMFQTISVAPISIMGDKLGPAKYEPINLTSGVSIHLIRCERPTKRLKKVANNAHVCDSKFFRNFTNTIQ